MVTEHMHFRATWHEATGSTYISWAVVEATGKPDECALTELASNRVEVIWQPFDAASVRTQALSAVRAFEQALKTEAPF